MDTMKGKGVEDRTRLSALSALGASVECLRPFRALYSGRRCARPPIQVKGLLITHFVSSCRHDYREKGPFYLWLLDLKSKGVLTFTRFLDCVGFGEAFPTTLPKGGTIHDSCVTICHGDFLTMLLPPRTRSHQCLKLWLKG